MPELARLGARFDAAFLDIRGRQFFGRFAEVPEGNPTQIVPQKRLLRVHQTCPLTAGDIVLDHAGLRYLLAEGPTGMARQDIVKKTFRCVQVNRHLRWTRMQRKVDPVMKVEVSAGNSDDLGLIWCQVDPREERLERSSHVADSYEKFKLYTNAALQIGDKVDVYGVTRAERVAGITVADVE